MDLSSSGSACEPGLPLAQLEARVTEFRRPETAALIASSSANVFAERRSGAFTGANERHRGIFEQADGGTVFLDEITEMPIDIQVKLLRFLENKKFRRVGSTKPIKSDVRIIAATNRDPQQAIANKAVLLSQHLSGIEKSIAGWLIEHCNPKSGAASRPAGRNARFTGRYRPCHDAVGSGGELRWPISSTGPT